MRKRHLLTIPVLIGLFAISILSEVFPSPIVFFVPFYWIGFICFFFVGYVPYSTRLDRMPGILGFALIILFLFLLQQHAEAYTFALAYPGFIVGLSVRLSIIASKDSLRD